MRQPPKRGGSAHKLVVLAYDKLIALRDKLFQQYKDELPVPMIGYDDTRGRIVARLANVPPCLIVIETGMATHYVARELITLGHDVRQLPPAYAKPFSTRSQERLP
jgi:transposase